MAAWGRRVLLAAAAAAVAVPQLLGVGGCKFKLHSIDFSEAEKFYVCLEPPPPSVPHTVTNVVCSAAGGWEPFCSANEASATSACQAKSCTSALLADQTSDLIRLYEWDINTGLAACPPEATFVNATPDPKDRECVDVTGALAQAAKPAKCDPPQYRLTDVYYCVIGDPKAVCKTASTTSALTVAPSYRATVARTPAADVVSDEDTSKRGVAMGRPGLPSLQFDRDAGGLTIRSLVLPVDDFTFDGDRRMHGSVALQNPGLVASDTGSGFAIPAGAASFLMLAADAGNTGYQATASNSTPLVISAVDGSLGPRLDGTLAGSLDGHPVHADVHATFAWINRPPVAVAHAGNVVFDSSQLPPCDTDPDFPRCKQVNHCRCGRDQWDVPWVGLAGGVTVVDLDASASHDPDPGERLIYSWNGTAPDTQPVSAWYFPAGAHTALLTVQDQYGASAMTSVTFKVKDDADPGCPLCASALRPPPALLRPRLSEELSPVRPPIPPTDLTAIRSVDFARSETSVLIGEGGLARVEALAGRPHRTFARRLFRQATTPSFGDPQVRRSATRDPFADACASGRAATTAVCQARCGNGRCEPTESCGSCPADCGPCSACSNGRCDAGETCASCPVDCGRCNPCGNRVCDGDESTRSCPADCRCGNGTCDRGEDPKRCARDCYCGNGVCDPDEDARGCPDDCRCGNGTCDRGESHASCARDCHCGDGWCDPRERHGSCRADCGRQHGEGHGFFGAICAWFRDLF